MKTRRQLSINNSLSHGICNFNCTLCGVNKPSYRGPKEFQSKETTLQLIKRVQNSAAEGLRIRYIANAGDGEPTLHPEFAERMDLFGEMRRAWRNQAMPAPEVSVVTNGLRLLNPGVLDAISRNGITLIVSFPTCTPESYGQIMVGDSSKGEELLSRVVPGIELALRLRAEKRIQRMQFHLSPPERETVRRDFLKTVEFISARAAKAGVESIDLILFPATSNRSGSIRNEVKGWDMYGDLFEKYNQKMFNGVRLNMNLSFKRFFPRLGELVDLIRAYNYPCTWNAQLFITAGGDSTCCNDQSVRNPMGNVRDYSLVELVEAKERHLPGSVCAACDQKPGGLRGSLVVTLFARLSSVKLWLSLARERLTQKNLVSGMRLP